MLKTAPDPIDVQDLQFKLRCRLKVFENTANTNFPQQCNLIACASRFGLIFVGTNTNNFQVIQLKNLEEYTKSDGDKADYLRRIISLTSPPKFLSVNCEHTILAVVLEKNSSPFALFYDVKSFLQKDVAQIAEVRLSPTPGVTVLETNWNPTLGAVFTACKSDGTLGTYEIKSPGVDINELPAAAGAACFCWSPKGKQIAVGSRDGKITQYKPDLKAVKVINAPPLKEPHSLISLQWISNYQFIGVFQAANGQSSLIVIDSPKTGEVTYMNYDDICYSNGNTRPVQFYMILQQTWNLLMVASSNSMEVGILGFTNDSWAQWIMGDAARAELPLSSHHNETLPVGFGLDIGSTQQIPWGESTLPPAPILLVLSHYGILCCFNVINLKEGIPTVCTPPDPVKDTSGLQYFISKSEIAHNVPQISKVETVTKNTTSSPSVFEIKPNVTKSSELSFSTTQASNLFGGQATLVPVTPGSKSNTPQSLYPNLNYQSLYPTLPNENKTMQTPTTSPLIAKAPSVIPTQPKTPVSTVSLPKLNQTKPKEDLSKTDIASVDLKAAEEEAEAVFAQMVKEECIFLESELKAVLHQGKTLKINLGSEDDKTKIVNTTKSIQDFFKELVDICKTQTSEVHILKQNLLQSWAWYEEVKSRYAASKDESIMILLRAQPLDSASEKQLEDIRHANYYLESQIAQAHRALDEQWENFQDYCKKTHRMQMPTMEIIFQTMVKQNAILKKQNYILKDIGSRIKSKSRSAIGSSLLLSFDVSKDLSNELKRLRMNPGDICQLQYQHVVNRTKNFTKKKSETLRSFLKDKSIPHVSAVKPQLCSTIIQTSPASKLKSTNLFNTKMSPVVTKETIPKKLDFMQATPKQNETIKTETQSIENKTSTPIEGLQNFTLNFEAKNFNKPSEQSFIPLTKSLIATSPNSAFVSTSFGTSTATPSSSTFKPVIFGTSTSVATTVTKAPTTYLIVTTTSSGTPFIINTANLSKPFTFTSTPATTSIFQQHTTTASITKPSLFSSTPSSTVAVSTGAKTTFTFTLPTTTGPKTVSSTAAPVFGRTTTATTKPTSVFEIGTTKAATTSFFSAVPSTKSVTTTASVLNLASPANKTTVTTSVYGTSTSGSMFALGTGASTAQNIFGGTSDKSTENKPFVFSSVSITKVTTAPASTTQNRVTATTAPTLTFVSPTTSSNEVKSAAQSVTPSVTIMPKTQAAAATTAATSSVFSAATTATTTKPPSLGIFAATSTTQGSIFGTATSTVPAQVSIFGTTVSKPSVFGASATATTASTPISVTPSVPGTTAVAAVPSSSVVSSAVAPSTTTTTTAPTSLNAVFGAQTTSQQSIFGSVTSTNAFAPVSSSTGFNFGSTATTKPVIFGSTDLSATKPSIFGSPATTAASVFGAAPTQNVTPVFGTSTSATSTASQPMFGTSTTSQSQAFGSSIFGDASQKSSIFGSTAPASPTQSSVFGSGGQGSIFGASTTTATSTFGQNQSIFDPPKTTQSIFGQSSGFGSTGSSFGSSNVFGNAASTFAQSGGSIFGSTATTTSGSIFGGTPTTSNVFGSGTSSVFGAPASSTPSVFGSSSVFSPSTQASTGSFGFGGLNVGSTPTTSSGFGASQPNPFGGENKNVFGTPSTPATSSVFGSSSGSLFGNPTQSFGSSSFGSGQSVFGQQSTFGQSAFGGGSFGQQTPGPFSGGSGSVAQSGFGGSASFQKPGGFGGSPVFGGTPSFGSAPSFGGAPAFGNPPAFGSPPKIFGSGSPGFGANSNAFGNLANQPTVGFGNLAQQASNTPASGAPFSGSSSFSSWR